jgi:hypothetical protein
MPHLNFGAICSLHFGRDDFAGILNGLFSKKVEFQCGSGTRGVRDIKKLPLIELLIAPANFLPNLRCLFLL